MTLDEIIRINKWINFLIAGFVFVLVQFYFNSDNYKDDLLMKYSFQVSRYELLQKTNESENLDHLKRFRFLELTFIERRRENKGKLKS